MTSVWILTGLGLAGSVALNVLLHWVCRSQAETITELLEEREELKGRLRR